MPPALAKFTQVKFTQNIIALRYASLSVKQFDTHCTPNERIVMETWGREAFVIGKSKVNVKKMLNVLPVWL